MTLTEIQSEVKTLAPSERLVLAAYLKHLARQDSVANQSTLDEAAGRMIAGEKISQSQLRQLHETLKAEGV